METCDLILYGGAIITQNAQREIISNGALAIQGSQIAAVSQADDILSRYQAKRQINASGQYIFPGLINTHTHFFQTLIKGLGEGLSLYEWIDNYSAPSSDGMSPEQAYLSGFVGRD